MQTALPNGVAGRRVPSAVSDVSGAGAFARAVCRTLPHSSFSQYSSCTHAQNVALATITCARRLFIASSSALTQPYRC